MHVNWFTVIAQVINFLILVWLLKRYLYKPILNAVDNREKKITSQLEDAEAQKALANKEKEEFEQKNKLFDDQQKELMQKAVNDSEVERQKLLEKARNEANVLQEKMHKKLEDIQHNMQHQIKTQIREEVLSLTRKTLAELASSSLEEEIVKAFISKIKTISPEEKKNLISVFQKEKEIKVNSAFELTDKQQKEITQELNTIFEQKLSIAFQIVPELISGIEIEARGHKLSWNLSEYIDSFEKKLSDED